MKLLYFIVENDQRVKSREFYFYKPYTVALPLAPHSRTPALRTRHTDGHTHSPVTLAHTLYLM